MHILSPETDNCPSWISGRERMTVENISWSISTKECCRPRRRLNPRPPGLQSDGASNWATEAGAGSDVLHCIRLEYNWDNKKNFNKYYFLYVSLYKIWSELFFFSGAVFFHITKTCLYNFDPLKLHFYIVKLGFTGVCIIFLISAQKHRLWVLVRTASARRF